MRLLAALLIFFIAMPAWSYEPQEIMKNPVLQKRAEDIYDELRCVVCQNQPIGSSNADLARDMRGLVRARLLDGDSDNEVIEYMVSRYGDFVLLNPPLKSITVLLWSGPAIFALIGLLALIFYFRRQARDYAATTGTGGGA